jgi:SAM-dependent methyltransferase
MAIKKYFGIVLNPIFLTTIRLQETLVSVIKPLIKKEISCLDVGCGERPYEYLFTDGKYTGIDVDISGRPINIKKPDYFYNGTHIPFKNEEFDIVLCTQVLEHVPDSLLLLKEMARVVKCGDGGVIISVPFVYPEHEQPFDYFRFTRFGITELLEKAGMKVEMIKSDSSAIETLAVLANVYILNNLVPHIRGMGLFYTIFLCFPIQLVALVLANFLPDNGHFYLNLIIHARKK